MGIYKKNYFLLTDEDKKIIKEYNNIFNHHSNNSYKNIAEYTKETLYLLENPFILNVNSYFPNNFLNHFDIKKNFNQYINKLTLFRELINNPKTSERKILNYIRKNEAHFIIASILKNFSLYGHHDRYIFQEFKLAPNYQADFLIIGKNSDGYFFHFVELENPYGNITIKSGAFGETFRKGIEQIEDWSNWLESNFNSLINIFNKAKREDINLPQEFYEYDSSRFEFTVVAGRRDDFNNKTYRLRRDFKKQGINILHYDNLIDSSFNLINSGFY